ncbi:MAG: hypothetical protein JXA78_11060 [Anaerolineales bacterium]|nr:hypothetical protein [Anaerolineales bacterium]
MMKGVRTYFALSLGLSLLAACALMPATTPQATEITQQATEQPVVQPTQRPASFALAEPGPYFPGKRSYAFEDASRAGRLVGVTIWYPAVRPEGFNGAVALDADPDLNAAPYPLLLSSTKMANRFAPYLVSHGFAWASVDRIDSYMLWYPQMIDQPLDILFALDQVATNPPEGLEGMIDAEHAGALGYSFDGFNSLALSGARVDPEYFLSQCASASTMQPPLEEWWVSYLCNLAGKWDEFTAHAGETLTASEDGLWQPMTDERIRAVMPMAPEGAWLFGERGLAAVDRPTLIIGATEDDICFYNLEAVYIFEHLGAPERVMISFVGQGHMMVYDAEMVARMAHFAVAFFGYHLQGRQEYAAYFSEDFVGQYEDLAWGVFSGD